MALSTAISASRVARTTGIEFVHQDLKGNAATFLPQRIVVIGQGATASQSAYSLVKRQVSTEKEVGATYGYGSPLHLAAMQLLPKNSDGVGDIPVTIYPLKDSGTGTVSSGTVTPSGSITAVTSWVIRANNIDSAGFTIVLADTVGTIIDKIVLAVAAQPNMPILVADGTTVLNVTSKHMGVSANDIVVEMIPTTVDSDGNQVTGGNLFAIVAQSNGTNNPTVDDALTQIGNVWETMILNCLDKADTTALDTYQTWGDGRWLPLVNKMAIVFTGDNTASVATSITLPEARKTDKVNCQLVSPGSKDLPYVIAARQLARIAVVANNNPGRDYGSYEATGLTPGIDSDQWSEDIEMNTAVAGGSSTIRSVDGVVKIADVVTFYHPTGEDPPAFRYVCDIVKLSQIAFGLQSIFLSAEWDGAPLINDEDTTTNKTAKKPKMAKADIAGMIDGYADEAVLADRKTIKESIQAEISATNPKRINVSLTVKLAGNTNIKSLTADWGFNYGTPTAI